MNAQTIEALIERTYAARATREQIQDILTKLAPVIGIEALQLDDEGQTGLIIGEDVPLLLVYFETMPGVIIASPMPDLTDDSRLEVTRRLLQANLSFELTRGGVFGILAPEQGIFYCRFLVMVDRETAAIADDLAQFVEDVRAWVEEIELMADLSGPTEAVAPAVDTGTARPTPDMLA